jgi:hypothetical protein
MPQMDLQQCEAGIQCELLSDRDLSGVIHSGFCSAPVEIYVINDSTNMPSENPDGIVNLSQEIEVFTTESGAVNVIADKSAKNDSRNNIKELNRPSTSDNEGYQYPESLKCMPSTNWMDRNYWTNGSRTPFAMVEVFLAAKNVSFRKGDTHKIGPLNHFNASESSRNTNDDGNQQQGKQLMARLSTELPDCTHKCNESKHKTVTEHHARKEQREVKCFNGTEEAHTISSKSRPVNVSCVTEESSRRLISQDILSNSNRGNSAQINDKTANSGNTIPLHLYTAGEPFTKSSPCSLVSNIGTTCEETINDHGSLPETTALLGENGENVVALQTPESSNYLLDESAVTPETSERPNGIRVIPETSEESDEQLHENAVAPETPQLDLLDENDPDIVPNTPDGNMITVQMCCSLKNKVVLRNIQDAAERKDKEIGQIKSSTLSDLLQSAVLKKCEYCINKSILIEHKYCKTVPSVNIRAMQNMYEYRRPTTEPIKETHNRPHATWCQTYFHRRGMSAEPCANVANFVNTTPMLNNLCSISDIVNRSNICQNPYVVLLSLKEDELSHSSILQIASKIQTVLSEDLCTVNIASRGEEEESSSLSIPRERSSGDNMFPSDQVMKVSKVTKTCGRTKCLQDLSKHLTQNSQSLCTLQKYTPSETDHRQWKSYQIHKVIGKAKAKNSAAFKKQTQLSFMPTSRQFKRKHEQSNSEYSSSHSKHRRFNAM